MRVTCLASLAHAKDGNLPRSRRRAFDRRAHERHRRIDITHHTLARDAHDAIPSALERAIRNPFTSDVLTPLSFAAG